jgi:hypothetical protein
MAYNIVIKKVKTGIEISGFTYSFRQGELLPTSGCTHREAIRKIISIGKQLIINTYEKVKIAKINCYVPESFIIYAKIHTVTIYLMARIVSIFLDVSSGIMPKLNVALYFTRLSTVNLYWYFQSSNEIMLILRVTGKGPFFNCNLTLIYNRLHNKFDSCLTLVIVFVYVGVGAVQHTVYIAYAWAAPHTRQTVTRSLADNLALYTKVKVLLCHLLLLMIDIYFGYFRLENYGELYLTTLSVSNKTVFKFFAVRNFKGNPLFLFTSYVNTFYAYSEKVRHLCLGSNIFRISVKQFCCHINPTQAYTSGMDPGASVRQTDINNHCHFILYRPLLYNLLKDTFCFFWGTSMLNG